MFLWNKKSFASFFQKQKRGVLYLLLFVAVVESVLLFLPSNKKHSEKPLAEKDTTYKKLPAKNFAKPTEIKVSQAHKKKIKKPFKKKINKEDINTADSESFKKVRGIGEVLSKRIVKYRKRLQGFSMKEQLYEVYGLDSTVVKRLFKYFAIKKTPKLKKINLNEASFKEILRHPYIDYPMTKKIFQYRDKHKKFKDLKSLKELLKLSDKRYEKIVLYLKI